jgi:acyl-CoA thioesterase-1
VDRVLAALSDRYDVPYIRTSDWSLTYLEDRLHLTPEGHRAFGDAVARQLATLP